LAQGHEQFSASYSSVKDLHWMTQAPEPVTIASVHAHGEQKNRRPLRNPIGFFYQAAAAVLGFLRQPVNANGVVVLP